MTKWSRFLGWLCALILASVAFAGGAQAASWPHLGHHNHGAPKLSKKQHSYQAKEKHPKPPKNRNQSSHSSSNSTK